MIRCTFDLVLMAVVLGCPVWCPMTNCCGAKSARDEGQAARGCCPHCTVGDPCDSENSPALPVGGSGDHPCQCFCSKAVIGKIADDAAPTRSVPGLPMDATAKAETADRQVVAIDAASPGLSLSGRDICCRNMRFLC